MSPTFPTNHPTISDHFIQIIVFVNYYFRGQKRTFMILLEVFVWMLSLNCIKETLILLALVWS